MQIINTPVSCSFHLVGQGQTMSAGAIGWMYMDVAYDVVNRGSSLSFTELTFLPFTYHISHQKSGHQLPIECL